MESSHKKLLVSGVKWNSVGFISKAVFQLLQISVLARFLSKEDFGLVAMALFVINFTNIFVDMGFTSAVLHRKSISINEYSSVFWLNLLMSLMLYALVCLFSSTISTFYNEPDLKVIIPVLGVNLMLLSVGRLQKTIMQKHFEFKSISLIEISSYSLGLVLAVIFAVKGFGVFSLVYSTLAASAISSFLFLFLNLKKHPIIPHFSFSEINQFLKIGSYSMGSQLVGFFSTDIDVLIIGKLLGAEALGVYSLSKQIVIKVYSIINSVMNRVMAPILSDVQDDVGRLRSYFKRVTTGLVSLNLPIYFFLIVFSKTILNILYGRDFSDAHTTLALLSAAYGVLAISNPVGSLQIATGRTDLGLKWSFVSVVITPVVVLFASYVSVEFVALARVLLSIIIIFPLWVIQIRPMIGMLFSDYFKCFGKQLMVFVLFVAVYFVLDLFFSQFIDGFPLFFLALIGLYLCYVFLMLFFFEENMKGAKSVLSQLFRGRSVK